MEEFFLSIANVHGVFTAMYITLTIYVFRSNSKREERFNKREDKMMYAINDITKAIYNLTEKIERLERKVE